MKDGIATDGPYVETKECVSGYYFLIANSQDEAKELAKGCPDLKRGATLEIRRIINTEKNNIDENIKILIELTREHYGKMVSYLSQKYGYHKIEDILDAVQESSKQL